MSMTFKRGVFECWFVVGDRSIYEAYIEGEGKRLYFFADSSFSCAQLQEILAFMKEVGSLKRINSKIDFEYNNYYKRIFIWRRNPKIVLGFFGSDNRTCQFYYYCRGSIAINELEQIVDFINSHSEISWKRVGF